MQLLFTVSRDVLQSKAGSIDHLQRVSACQTAELMRLQQEVYHLRALLSTHNIDPALVRLHDMRSPLPLEFVLLLQSLSSLLLALLPS